MTICPVEDSADGVNIAFHLDQQSPAEFDVSDPPSAVSYNPPANRSFIDSSDEDPAGWSSDGAKPAAPEGALTSC